MKAYSGLIGQLWIETPLLKLISEQLDEVARDAMRYLIVASLVNNRFSLAQVRASSVVCC